jgi:hypothetical protein
MQTCLTWGAGTLSWCEVLHGDFSRRLASWGAWSCQELHWCEILQFHILLYLQKGNEFFVDSQSTFVSVRVPSCCNMNIHTGTWIVLNFTPFIRKCLSLILSKIHCITEKHMENGNIIIFFFCNLVFGIELYIEFSRWIFYTPNNHYTVESC